MQSINLGGSALRASGLAAPLGHGDDFVVLGAMAWSTEAMAWTGQPLAYVSNTALQYRFGDRYRGQQSGG